MSGVFEEEHEAWTQFQVALQKQDLNAEELRSLADAMTSRFGNLLKQTEKLTKVGDSAQNRLMRIQNELQTSNSKLEKSIRNLQLLSELGKVVTSSLDAKKILSELYEQLKDELDLDIISVGSYDKESDNVKYKFSLNQGSYVPSIFLENLNEDNYSSMCIRGNHEVIVEDILLESEERRAGLKKQWGEEIRSVVFIPLMVEDRVVGVFTIQSRKPNAYNNQQLNMIRSLASYLGIGLDNADAYRSLSKRNKDLKSTLEKVRSLNENLALERQKSENLLLNILPGPIAERLKGGEEIIADFFPDSSVLFADIAGFTVLSSKMNDAEKLVSILNDIFRDFDNITQEFGLEKIKTIGDCYMLAGGIPNSVPDHLERMAEAALRFCTVFNKIKSDWGYDINVRIGIHVGEVVAGVIGKYKFVYDLWGDTVNIASRMESHGQVGRIHVSKAVFERLRDKYAFESRGEIEVKGKGKMETWFLTGQKD
ncbi:adenylate/guanylate cyclase catalytic domain protein [Leptospira ryugenii]|uniref:Adenylate cyclase n=1 Tax=Leptospira ryugenii TaxID=1917863 RepID=A0A2P2E1Y0_9LEPT|nr:adenylate/guanylate cyclase domain-containing protein [Leptospira ryugenii]GBF50913.1 adenylate/guanylate cyclase catalytic domain protein [Leptospira ryugenii]